MSIFGNIARAIFGTSSTPGTTAATGTSSAAPSAPTAPSSSPAARTATVAPAATPGGEALKSISMGEVETMIKNIADSQSEKLNWKQSIVDLMKLLKLDSSLSARKELAQELGYKGALDGSAEMNVWLHKQVMTKLAESGGKVPDSLRT